MGLDGYDSSYDDVQIMYDESIKHLTAQEVHEIERKAQEYLKTHTVRYQKRIKDYEYTLDSIKEQSN